MLLLGNSGVPYSNFQLFGFLPQIMVSIKYKVLNTYLFFQQPLISMSHTDIPICLTLFEDCDSLTCALYKLMMTHAQDSYL